MDVPRSCQVYLDLMKNYMGLILDKGYDNLTEDSDNLFERGLYRSTLTYFNEHHKK
jgi:alanine dehydrogenase